MRSARMYDDSFNAYSPYSNLDLAQSDGLTCRILEDRLILGLLSLS